MILLTILLLPPGVRGATSPGTPIANVAELSYTHDGTVWISRSSNAVTLTSVARPRTLSAITFLKHAPTSDEATPLQVPATEYRTGDSTGTAFRTLPAPLTVPDSKPIDLSAELPLAPAAIFHRGEPVFLRLADPDQNLDPAVAETVLVTLTAPESGDAEALRLTETGPDTGVFAGYIQSSPEAEFPYDGYLEVSEAGAVEARYVDPFDGSDRATEATLFDPFGIVFDSRTGLPVNGATVTLVEAASGNAANVYGDDGISRYPSTLVTGGTATDSDGNLYAFSPGGFRFPFVAPGTYRLEVTPPSGYEAPSAVSDGDLQDLPGAPFALAVGSRGEAFRLDPGPALRIDIPVDPVAAGALWLRKNAEKSRVAAGDFLPYRVAVENPGASAVPDVTIADRLPVGFRYRGGSARLDGAAIADPDIFADGRALNFDIGSLPADGRVELRYVVEVTSGAPTGEAVNTAEASSASGILSNTAEAAVTVGEDFFRSSTFLLGRVRTGGCGDPGPEEPDGLAGARIYLEDGTYVVTDKRGMFHFEGMRPGTHVVQLDLDSLPDHYDVVACEENSRFAGRAFSRFVDLQEGAMWRTDFHVALKPRPRGEVGIKLNGDLNGGTATFGVPIRTTAVPVKNARLSLILPEGAVYLPGSSTLDGAALPDPEAGFGGILTYRLGDFPANRTSQVLFRCDLSECAVGEISTQAVLTFDSPTAKNQRTPPAENLLSAGWEKSRSPLPEFTIRPHFPTLGTELSGEDRDELDRLAEKLRGLDILRLYAVGHTDDVPIARRNRHLFADNQALSEARARSVARYLGAALDLPPSRIVIAGLGETVPVATNSTSEGRALNRRVEVRVRCEKVVQNRTVEMLKKASGEQKAEIQGLREGRSGHVRQKLIPSPSEMPDFDDRWFRAAQPGMEWIWPHERSDLAIPSTKVAVKHPAGARVVLRLNGAEVSPLNFDATLVTPDKPVALSLWRGVDLDKGDNLFEARVLDSTGRVTGVLRKTIHYATLPRKAELVAESSTLRADGNSPPVIAVRFVDRDGYPAREGVVGEFTVDPPYAALAPKETVARSVRAEEQDFRPHFRVGPDGTAFIPLEPTSRPGEVVLHFNLADREEEIRAWLSPADRDWIMVGLAEGTVGYNELSGNLENLPSDVDEDLYEKGRVAFFAKGRVLGKWLLTLAYDSDKPGRKDEELFQVIDPDSYYTLYGDATQQAYEAASAEKLYFKLAREQFYALFGDFDTGLSKTELSRYSRSLTGLKSEYNGRYATFNLFVSDTDQGFVKDEIRGDGNSGLYRLSRRDIVLNSEKVTIEVRDRFQSQEILSSQELTRHLDYDIDYDAGTLFFKEPVPSRDEALNPIYIIVDYEVVGREESSLNYGGRASVRWPGQSVEIGATAIHEDRDNNEGDLYGIDATWEITEKTRLKAEVATSDRSAPGVSRHGSAWLTELEHRSADLDGRLYMRELETGFGLGQQSGSEEGTRKFGAEGLCRLTDELELGGRLYRQANLETDAVRDVAESDLTYKADRYSLSTGLRFAEDDFEGGAKERSTQALFGGTWLATERLQLRATHEQSIGDDNDNSDFPTRTTLGADFRLTPSTSLFAVQEFTVGDDAQTQNTRVGLKTTPWTGGSVESSLAQQTGEYGPRMFALFGLGQTLQLTERWSVDASLDRSQTIREPDAESFDTDVPPTSGDREDFTSVSMGATCKLEKWSWANRLEYRYADAEDKWGLFSALVGEVREGLAMSARLQLFTTESATAGSSDGKIRLGLAYRPLQTRWIVLNRLDLRFDKESTTTSGYNNWRLVNNLNANYKPNRRTQISFQYGGKYVKENIDGDSYDGFTDLVGFEGRYDLDERWDIGLRGSMLHSWEGGQIDFGAGASLGYNAMKNTWVSVGYNVVGFEDEDFSRADFTSRGPFVRFRLKFDQGDLGKLADSLQL